MFLLITRLIDQIGPAGVFLLMLVENVFPGIPSEIIMPMAGFAAASGRMSLLGVVLAGAAGSVLGAVVWYLLGRRLGVAGLRRLAERHGRWLTLSPEEVARAEHWFRRWGALAVTIGRCLPGVRGVIVIPAGVAGMRFWPFLLWCSLGSLVWSLLLTMAGYLLRQHFEAVTRWLNPVTDGFVVLGALIYIYRVITFPTPSGRS